MNYHRLLIVIICIILPTVAGATAYQPLVGIPGITGTGTLDQYLNTLYALSISIAALLAVVKIIIAGVKYMLSDVVTNKSSAIKDIQGSLLGLILVVMAWVILYVINPAILNVEITTQPMDLPPGATLTPRQQASALNIQPGDRVFRMNPSTPLAQRQNECENIVPDRCPTNLIARQAFPEEACYVGEFFPESNNCVVRAANLRLPRYECVDRGPSIDGGREYDCGAALAQCSATGRTGTQVGGYVDCN
jgi:hypothetical protein